MDTATLAEPTPTLDAAEETAHRRLVRSLLVACLAAGAWLMTHTP